MTFMRSAPLFMAFSSAADCIRLLDHNVPALFKMFIPCGKNLSVLMSVKFMRAEY